MYPFVEVEVSQWERKEQLSQYHSTQVNYIRRPSMMKFAVALAAVLIGSAAAFSPSARGTSSTVRFVRFVDSQSINQSVTLVGSDT